MKDEKVREAIQEYALEHEVEIPMFDQPAFDKSIVGISDDNRLIYDYNKMVKECCKDNHWKEETAIEWIDYNTIRYIPYMGENAPIIMRSLL